MECQTFRTGRSDDMQGDGLLIRRTCTLFQLGARGCAYEAHSLSEMVVSGEALAGDNGEKELPGFDERPA